MFKPGQILTIKKEYKKLFHFDFYENVIKYGIKCVGPSYCPGDIELKLIDTGYSNMHYYHSEQWYELRNKDPNVKCRK
jgi:hypothetical protein